MLRLTLTATKRSTAAVLHQLHSQEPLFKRCISMSGTPIMLKPLSPLVTEQSYGTIMKELGLENASIEERIERLKNISPEELVAKTPMNLSLLPYIDGDIVPARISFAKLAADHSTAGSGWCEEMMIGDCQDDGNVFVHMGLEAKKAGIAQTLSTSLHTHLPADAAAAVLHAYKIDPEPTTFDELAMMQIVELATDIAYSAPALAYARSFPGKTYRYHFNERNPWVGPFSGFSTHMLDAAFLFQNFNENLSPQARKVAQGLAADFIKFANGVKPWPEHSRPAEFARTYGPSHKYVIDVVGWGKGRSKALWKLAEEGKVNLDDLSGAWDIFIAGK